MLHIVYRSYGGENRKSRPPWYSKLLALGSLLRAKDRLSSPVEILYLNDGPIPPDRLRVMERTGEVIARAKLGNAGSLRLAYALPRTRSWADHDLVWYAEDDYLYRPDALSGYLAAAAVWPEASYFSMYASFGWRGSGPPVTAGTAIHRDTWVPSEWRDSEPRSVEGHPWRRALSTTSTFGGRAGAIAQDETLLNVAMMAGRAFDATTCLLLQGHRPFTLRLIAEPVRESLRWKSFAISAARIAVDAWQLTHRGPKRLLVASEPSLCTHLELPYLALGSDWDALAHACERWSLEAGFTAHP
ncbi:MAG TPA: hypothetical protein VGI70_21985 [Polyangiales bacterium]|jgi:hypothetical protein